MSRTGRNSPQAFSLLELVLVLLLLALGAAMAVPMLGRFARGQESLGAAGQMLALMHYAQERAANDAVVYRFNLSPREGAYWLTMQKGGAFEPPSTDFGRRFQVPSAMRISWNSQPDELMETMPEASADPYVQFYPDGGHDAGEIELVGRFGDAVRILAASQTEPFRVVEGGAR